MPTTSINMPLPQVSGINQLPSARKTAPKPKSRGSSGSKQTKRKYQKKKMEYWNKLGRKEGKKNKKETRG